MRIGNPENFDNIPHQEYKDDSHERLNELRHLLALVPKSEEESKEIDEKISKLRSEIDIERENYPKRTLINPDTTH